MRAYSSSAVQSLGCIGPWGYHSGHLDTHDLPSCHISKVSREGINRGKQAPTLHRVWIRGHWELQCLNRAHGAIVAGVSLQEQKILHSELALQLCGLV